MQCCLPAFMSYSTVLYSTFLYCTSFFCESDYSIQYTPSELAYDTVACESIEGKIKNRDFAESINAGGI